MKKEKGQRNVADVEFYDLEWLPNRQKMWDLSKRIEKRMTNTQ